MYSIVRIFKGDTDMKKILSVLSVIVIIALAFSACAKKDGSLSVKEKNIRMNVGGKYTVKLASGDSDNVEWVSADKNIAVVATDGTVTAVNSGVTTVTAKNEDSFVHIGVIVAGNTGTDFFSGESDITEIVVGVKGGGKNDISVKAGDELTLTAYITPSDSEDEIMWKTSDETIVRVDKQGKIKVVGKGKATVTAYAPNRVKGELIVRSK